jgi:conjugal transfer/type IV secretion protein DotA/TraY
MAKNLNLALSPWAALGAALLALLSPALALAAPSLGFDPACSDKSMSDYLVPLFNSLFSSCGGVPGPFEHAMGALNAGALSIGGVLAAYTLVAGTMQTAHDGEMLGKRWSSMWLPIRTTLGVALVVPVNGGFCVAQILMAFMIGQGVGLADKVWSTYLTDFATPAGMAPRARLPNVADLARGMLNSQLCMEAYNSVRESALVVMDTPIAATSPSPGIRNFGTYGSAQCGSVYFDTTPITPGNAMGDMAVSYDAGPLSAVQTAHMAAALVMESSMNTVAKSVVQSYKNGAAAPDIGLAINAATIAYQTAVASSANSVFGNSEAMNTFVAAAKNDGWYMAGAWFMKATQMQDAVNQVVSHTPTTVAPDSKQLASLSPDLAPFFARLSGLLRDSTQNQTAQASTATAVDQLGNSSNPLQKAIQGFMNWTFGGNWIQTMAQADPNRNALMSMKDFGDYLMTGSEAGMGFGVAMIGGAEAIRAENSSFLGNALGVFTGSISTAVGGASAGTMSAVGTLLVFFSVALFAFAASIAVYLPMAPFLIYFGAFIGWVILCAEAIIAAPLWAVMHLTPSGDDIMGGARNGYQMMLGVILRPVLILTGFLFALAASSTLAGGFNKIFFPAFKLAMAGSVIGLGTSFAMIAIYFGAMVWMLHTTFGLIHIIPDKLLRWIGGGHEQLGESARGMSKTGEAGAGAAATHARGMQSSLTQGLQTKSMIDAAEQGRKIGAKKDADRERFVMDEKTSSAAVAGAKADAPRATNEHKLAAISRDLAASAQIDAAVDKQAQSDKSSRTTEAPKLAAENQPKQQSLRENASRRAQDMERAATDSVEAIGQAKDPEQARDTAKRNSEAAARAYEMLAKHESTRPASSSEDIFAKFNRAQEYADKAKALQEQSNKLG